MQRALVAAGATIDSRERVAELFGPSTVAALSADSPSVRVMALLRDTKNRAKDIGVIDQIVFGTGDQLHIQTTTADKDFVRAARTQGLVLDVWVHPSNSYATK